MPIFEDRDINSLPNATDVVFGYRSKSFIPNINTSDNTIDLGGDFVIRTKNNFVAISNRSVSICDRSINSGLQALVYSFSSNSFRTIRFSTKDLNENDVILGIVRFNDNINFVYNKAYFPFEFTVDGKNYEKQVDDLAEAFEEISTRIPTDCLSSNVLHRGTATYWTISTPNIYLNGSTTKVSFNELKGKEACVRFECESSSNKSLRVLGGDWATLQIIDISGVGETYVKFIETDSDFVYLRVLGTAEDPDELKIIIDFDRLKIIENKIDDAKAVADAALLEAEKVETCGNVIEQVGISESGLGWNQNDLAKNRVKTLNKKCFPGYSFFAEIKSDSDLYFGLHENNSAGSRIYDSGWVKKVSRTFSENAVTYDLWVKKSDNSIFTADEIESINSQFESWNVESAVSGRTPAAVELVLGVKEELRSLAISLKNVRNIAHQGYSTTSQYFGNSRVSSYIGAAKNGFDFGECDVQFSSDDVAVCCHDATFIDGFSGNVITIAEHTVEELKTYQYYGETIATFEEVVAICKKVGIGLYVDKCANFLADETRRNHIFGIVQKYAMEKKVCWTIGASDTWYDPIRAWFPHAGISLIVNENYISDNTINFANSIYNGLNSVDIAINYNNFTVEQILSYIPKLKPGVGFLIWTPDTQELYERYKPYVSGITSNKISEFLIR